MSMLKSTVPSPKASPVDHRVVVQIIPGPAVPFAMLAAAGALIAGTSAPAYASVVDANRLSGSGSTVFIALREKDCFSLADVMAELKLKTGLTWDQLGKFFAVSRQTIHSWSKGSPIKAAHRERVEDLLSRVRALKDLRPFEIRRDLNLAEAVALPPSSEPAILVSDPRLDADRAKLRKGTSLRVVRKNGASG